jgi:hypothetical protein
MKRFIRENPTIAFGLGLPLLLVVLFLAISGIPTLFVAPAQYDVLYATNTHNNTYQIAVTSGQVRVDFIGKNLAIQPYEKPRLWRFNPRTGAVREIALLFPPGLAPQSGTQPFAPTPAPPQVIPIEVPDLAGIKVDSSSLAPDGYQFSTGADGNSGHVFSNMFYGSSYRSHGELVKNGRSIRLPNTDGVNYGYNLRFIGWVVSP